MSSNVKKVIILALVFCVLTWIFVLRGGERVGRVYELAYLVVSFVVVGTLIRWFWPDSKGMTLAELRPYLVPVGVGFGIAGLFIVASFWKPFEYIIMPVPAIVLVVLLMRWRRKRGERSRDPIVGVDDEDGEGVRSPRSG